jgi:hypothetical protein
MKSKIGLNLGLGINVPISEIFSFQPELQFIQKGYRIKFSESDQGFSIKADGKVNLNYLEVPVLIKAAVGADDLKFFFAVGPSIGVGLGGKGKLKLETEFLGAKESTDEDFKVKFGDEPDPSARKASSGAIAKRIFFLRKRCISRLVTRAFRFGTLDQPKSAL